MNYNTDKFFIITGGPGSGKTSIINELKNRGYYCIDEGARATLIEQKKINGDGLPWKNFKKYQNLLLEYEIEGYKKALMQNRLTFFDCSIFEIMAYDILAHNEHSPALLKAANEMHFNNKAFIAPPWKEIFHKDSERFQTYEESVNIYYEIIKIYEKYGFHLIEIPKLTIEKRADFILNHFI